MFEGVRQWLCRVFHVPPEPEPPYGAPESVRIFRAGLNYFRLRLLGWSVGQFFAFAGIVFWIGLLHQAQVEKDRAPNAPPPAAGADTPKPRSAETRAERNARAKERLKHWNNPDEVARNVRPWLKEIPGWVFPVLWGLKILGLLVYVTQMLITYSVLRLDYELRWYMVTDRSLRIRSGIWRVQEMTMSFANLQHITMSQGPLQRLLGIADVRVQSAGGGGGGADHSHGQHRSLHTGFFHGVENAPEIRDLILERLRQFRETGLGDPDEVRHAMHAAPAQAEPLDAATLAAATDLLAAARELRQSIAKAPPRS